LPETTVNQLIEMICRSFQPERSEGFEAKIHIHLEGEEGGDWIVQFLDQECRVETGSSEDANLNVEATAQDVIDIYDGRLDAMKAFMQGRLRLKGDRGLALRMVTMFKIDRK
jgi:putative sterol carrier protein